MKGAKSRSPKNQQFTRKFSKQPKFSKAAPAVINPAEPSSFNPSHRPRGPFTAAAFLLPNQEANGSDHKRHRAGGR